MPRREGCLWCVEWLLECQRDGSAEYLEGAGLDWGGGSEFLDLLSGEADGLPVEGGQVAEQVLVAADGKPVAVVLGGVFGPGLG